METSQSMAARCASGGTDKCRISAYEKGRDVYINHTDIDAPLHTHPFAHKTKLRPRPREGGRFHGRARSVQDVRDRAGCFRCFSVQDVRDQAGCFLACFGVMKFDGKI